MKDKVLYKAFLAMLAVLPYMDGYIPYLSTK